MLIQIAITNFRSFRDRQVFSMVAAPRAGKRENTFIPNIKGEKFPALLKVAAIYGPNASGKSSLVRAFEALNRCVENTAESTLPFKAFKFDPELKNKPSEIEIDFIEKETRYTFYVSGSEDRVYAEHLYTYKKGRQILLYRRDYTEGKEQYTFGELDGEDAVHNAWRQLTGPRVLFLKQAVLNSSEELTQLLTPYSWLSKHMSGTFNHQMKYWAETSKILGLGDKVHADGMSSFLRSVDVPITSINFEKEGRPSKNITIQATSEDKKPIKTTLIHKTALGEAEFDFSEESDGTKNLLGFWLPYTLLGGGDSFIRCLVVDELDSSLHPSIVKMLVKEHVQNQDHAQLIFTTHDTHLMNSQLLRRDQIWLTERDRYGATQLRSVYEFEGREGENVEKRYFEGRYRSLPILASEKE